jgi:hypothetical protein
MEVSNNAGLVYCLNVAWPPFPETSKKRQTVDPSKTIATLGNVSLKTKLELPVADPGLKVSWVYQRAVILYMECRPLPSLRYFGHVGFLFNILAAAAKVGNCFSSQLSSSLAGQAVQYGMAGGTEYKSSHPTHPSPPARQGRTPCWVNSLRLSASVGVSLTASESSTIQLQQVKRRQGYSL